MMRSLLVSLSLLLFADLARTQPVPYTSDAPSERTVVGLGDRVLYDSAEPSRRSLPYTASPEGSATLELHVNPGTTPFLWYLAILKGSTITYFNTDVRTGVQTITISLDPGTYEALLFQFTGDDFNEHTFIHKDIVVSATTRDTLRASDADRSYTTKVTDETGTTVNQNGWPYGALLYHEPSGYYVWNHTTGGLSQHIVHHTAMPSTYIFDIELTSHPNRAKRYRVGFRTRDFSQSRMVTNDPADFLSYTFTVPVTDPMQPGVGFWVDDGGYATIFTLPPYLYAPYEVQTYVQRQPTDPFPHPVPSFEGGPPYRFAAFEIPIEFPCPPTSCGYGYFHPALPSVEHRSDGRLHLGYPTSYHTPTVVLQQERLPIDLAPVHYFGRIHRFNETEFLSTATPDYSLLPTQGGGTATVQPFPAQANTADLNPVAYTLYDADGDVIASGPDAAVLFVPGFPQSGPEPRALVLAHDRTRIGSTPSLATARLNFDLDRADPSPPALGYLTLRQGDRLTDTVTDPAEATLAFSILDESAAPTVVLDYRAHDDPTWIALPFTPDGGGYRAPLPADLPLDALYDLRFTLSDAAGNETLFTVEPAFATATPTAAEPNAPPERLALARPYPNPSHTVTAVAFSLSQPGRVRLAAYDLLGRKVAVVVDEERAGGMHEATLDVSGWPSGVYVLRLTASGGQVQRRFTVVR